MPDRSGNAQKSMLVFIDESGDGGMKLDKGSSPYFVVALVAFPDPVEAQRCDNAVSAHRVTANLPREFEFHCAENSPRQREAFLRAVHEFDFRSYVFALDKRKAAGPDFRYTDTVYRSTARRVLELASASLVGAKVVLDGSGNRYFRRELTAYLRREINTGGAPRAIHEVRIQPAHQNNLLQVADYVASINARAIAGKADGARLKREYLSRQEAAFRVGPL